MKSNRKKNFFTGLTVFIVIFLLAFFGIQFFTKTGIFRIPGVVYYDESLNASELELLKSIFTEEKGIEISGRFPENMSVKHRIDIVRPAFKRADLQTSV